MIPSDLKSWSADDYHDSFQIMDPYTAMKLLACFLFAGAIFERWM